MNSRVNTGEMERIRESDPLDPLERTNVTYENVLISCKFIVQSPKRKTDISIIWNLSSKIDRVNSALA